MWKLPKPNVADAGNQLDTALGADNKEAFVLGAPEREAIIALYEAYDANLGRPDPVLLGSDLREACKAAVHAAYSQIQESGRLSGLRSELKLGASECPYCGFGQIQDLDHHLPKAIYRLLSIYPANLIPCCATCNRHKPRRPSGKPREHFLNVYLEELPDSDFLIAEATLDAKTGGLNVTFEISKTHGMSDELYARLQHHMKEFRLNERYRAQVNIHLSALEEAIETIYTAGGANAVRDFLLRSASKSSFGRNDWRVALLRGLAQSAEFCNGGFRRAIGRPITGA